MNNREGAILNAIRNCAPLQLPKFGDVEVHILTSANDCICAAWALRTLMCSLNLCLPVRIHDDGTLKLRHCNFLYHLFPGAEIIIRSKADVRMRQALAPFSRCLQLRHLSVLAMKLFDFAEYCTAEKYIVMDSDVLFFSPAKFLRDQIESGRVNSFNRDLDSVYTVDLDATVKHGFVLEKAINSGLGVVHRQSIQFDLIEEYLSLPTTTQYDWSWEQTLYAMCSTMFGHKFLPKEYDVYLNGRDIESQVSRHYVKPIRELFVREGLKVVCERMGIVIDLSEFTNDYGKGYS